MMNFARCTFVNFAEGEAARFMFASVRHCAAAQVHESEPLSDTLAGYGTGKRKAQASVAPCRAKRWACVFAALVLQGRPRAASLRQTWCLS